MPQLSPHSMIMIFTMMMILTSVTMIMLITTTNPKKMKVPKVLVNVSDNKITPMI